MTYENINMISDKYAITIFNIITIFRNLMCHEKIRVTYNRSKLRKNTNNTSIDQSYKLFIYFKLI